MKERKKVLYVDDEPINLLILKRILDKKYEVITAESGHEALSILEEKAEIELIISDLKMTGMSGMEFIQEAQKRFETKKYFVLSSYTINDEMQKALDNKIILAYFEKPAEAAHIDKVLQENINNSGN